MRLSDYTEILYKAYRHDPKEVLLWVDNLEALAGCHTVERAFRPAMNLLLLTIANQPFDFDRLEEVLFWTRQPQTLTEAEGKAEVISCLKEIANAFAEGIVNRREIFKLLEIVSKMAAGRNLSFEKLADMDADKIVEEFDALQNLTTTTEAAPARGEPLE
jgi:hypothetical protein